MLVSIIIVNYHTVVLVENTIKSVIEKTENIDFEFIIVDNNSGDDLTPLNRLKLDSIHIYYLPENLGFGKACNYGANHSKGEYLFFLNPDTILRNNAILILVNALNQNKEYGIVGGNLYTTEGDPNLSYGPVLPSITDDLYGTTKNILYNFYLKRNLFFNSTGRDKDVAYITGADIMIKADVFSKTGGFDKRFFMYYEDADLSARIKELGLRVVSIPSAEIVHLEGRSVDFKEKRFKLIYEGRKTYYCIHYSKLYIIIADLLRCVYTLFSCILYVGNVEKIKMQLKKLKIFLTVSMK